MLAQTMRVLYLRFGFQALMASLTLFVISLGFTLMGYSITIQGN